MGEREPQKGRRGERKDEKGGGGKEKKRKGNGERKRTSDCQTGDVAFAPAARGYPFDGPQIRGLGFPSAFPSSAFALPHDSSFLRSRFEVRANAKAYL